MQSIIGILPDHGVCLFQGSGGLFEKGSLLCCAFGNILAGFRHLGGQGADLFTALKQAVGNCNDLVDDRTF